MTYSAIALDKVAGNVAHQEYLDGPSADGAVDAGDLQIEVTVLELGQD